jgi:hypothetical protein
VLLIRFLRSWWRTPIMIAAEASQYLVLALFSGLLYLRQVGLGLRKTLRLGWLAGLGWLGLPAAGQGS